MRNKYILVLLAAIAFLGSCRTTRNYPYFALPTYDSSHLFVYESYEVPIQVGDQLHIVVSALNPESAAIYNLPEGVKGLTVDQEGYISYPQLGNIKVIGLTKPQLKDLLIYRLKSYLADPVVLIEFVNFKVTMLGEVNAQGVLDVPDGKINILEALAKAGDVTMYGKKQQVQIIREANGKREFGWINLYSPSIFTSPYFRLRQNDIIYVHPIEDKPTANEQVLNRRLGLYTTIFGLASTIGLLILNLLK